MLSLPPHIYLIGALIAWASLMLTWHKHVREVSEQRRLNANSHVETAPDIKGASNYERAELRENAHRAQHITPQEKWIGRGLFFSLPLIILIVFLTQTQL